MRQLRPRANNVFCVQGKLPLNLIIRLSLVASNFTFVNKRDSLAYRQTASQPYVCVCVCVCG